MKATLYKKLTNQTIQCIACNRRCIISPQQTGYCRMRSNQNNELILSNIPSSIAVDPIEKKPLYHFLPASKSYSIGTYGCNFKCKFCQNHEISQPQDCSRSLSQFKSLSSDVAVHSAIKNGCRSISYTYNEPTIFSEYAHSIGIHARKNGLHNIFVTNGYATNECWDYLSSFIDAANIDLKGNRKFYKELCGGVDYEKVLSSISYAKSKGIWIEITTLIIPGLNEDVKEIEEFICSVDHKMPWHLTAFFPRYQMKDIQCTNARTLERIKDSLSKRLEYVYCGNVLSKHQNTYCPKCNELLIKRNGFKVALNSILKNACPKCKYTISGVFE